MSLNSSQLPRRQFIFLLGAGLCHVLGGADLRAEEDKQTGQGSNVQKLFDGKSLDGWTVVEFGGQGEVDVRDGAIRMNQGEPITGIVWSGKEIPRTNYEFSMQARKIDGSDFFATVTFPIKDNCCSFVLGGWGGGLIGISSLDGADASENETTDYFSFQKNRWYHIRIRVTDQKLESWIDEKQVVNVDLDNRTIGVRIEMELSKPLGISTYQTVGEVKDVQITRLDPAKIQEQADK